MGIGIYFSPVKKGNIRVNSLSDYSSYFVEGVAINVFNPFVFILWITILTTYQDEPLRVQWTFVAAMLAVVAICDVLKAYFANKLGSTLNDDILSKIKRIAGILIALFGVILLVRSIVSAMNQ